MTSIAQTEYYILFICDIEDTINCIGYVAYITYCRISYKTQSFLQNSFNIHNNPQEKITLEY